MDRKLGAHRIKINSGLWQAYKDFRIKYRLIYPEIDRKKYVSLCHLINTTLSDRIIKESMDFRMPHRLGTLSIRKSKLKICVKNGKLEKNKMIVDWGKTWEYWNKEYPGMTRKEINAIDGKIAIYNMNEHTNGYIMGWNWDKSTCNIHNQTVYSFRPTKRNRLALAEWIKSDEKTNDYYLKKKLWKQKQRAEN
jgi:hypothetical protein